MRLKEYKTEAELDEGIKDMILELKARAARTAKEGYEYTKWLMKNIKNSRITKAVVRVAVNIAYRVTIGSFMESCRGSWRQVSKYIKRNNLSYEFIAIINMVFNNNYRSLEDVERDTIKLPMMITEDTDYISESGKKLSKDSKAIKMVKDAMATYVPYMSAVKLTAMLINGKYKEFEFKGEVPSNYDIALAMMWVVLINTNSLRDLNLDWGYLKRTDQLYIGRKEALNIGYTPKDALATLPDGTPVGAFQEVDDTDDYDTEFIDPDSGKLYGEIERGRF